jgi:hypothetical protein
MVDYVGLVADEVAESVGCVGVDETIAYPFTSLDTVCQHSS